MEPERQGFSPLRLASSFFPPTEGLCQLLGCQRDGNSNLKLSFLFYINLKRFVCRVASCFVVGVLLALSVKELVHQGLLGPAGTQPVGPRISQTAALLRKLLSSSVSSGA